MWPARCGSASKYVYRQTEARMTPDRPHFLLMSDTRSRASHEGVVAGQWRFVLESLEGGDRLEVGDSEPEVQGERLELLTVIRGLEALDQPSRVTLVTPSRYVSRGLRYGLSEWRGNAWCWEHDGTMVPMTNGDLWQRLDQALTYHDVQCRWLRCEDRQRSIPDEVAVGRRPSLGLAVRLGTRLVAWAGAMGGFPRRAAFAIQWRCTRIWQWLLDTALCPEESDRPRASHRCTATIPCILR